MNRVLSVWVGCLACYNNGELNGEWATGHDAVDWECDNPEHEETWIFDHEEGDILGHEEWDPQDVEVIQKVLDGIDEDLLPAVVAYCDNNHIKLVDVDVSDVEDQFQGEYTDWDEFVYEFVEGTGLLSGVPEDIKYYFDYDRFGRDLGYDYWTADSDGGVLIFRNF